MGERRRKSSLWDFPVRTDSGSLWSISALYRKQTNQKKGDSSCHITFGSCCNPREQSEWIETGKGKSKVEQPCSKCRVWINKENVQLSSWEGVVSPRGALNNYLRPAGLWGFSASTFGCTYATPQPVQGPFSHKASYCCWNLLLRCVFPAA